MIRIGDGTQTDGFHAKTQRNKDTKKTLVFIKVLNRIKAILRASFWNKARNKKENI